MAGAPLKIELKPEEAGKRLDLVLHQRFPQYSRARLQDWIKDGRVLVNGEARRASYLVRSGEAVDVEPAGPAPLHAAPEEIPLTVLYAGVHSGTLVNALLHRFGSLSRAAGELRPGIVHRLDRYTSGVLLVAKNDAAHQRLAEQFASRKVEKTYLALVHGNIKQERERIEKPITRDPKQRVRMTARLASGRAAWSEYRVLRRLPGFTFLKVRIGTGRTHQIRVHLASIGHPVVGDCLYGAPAKIAGQPTLPRYFLHAHRITFAQPSTGQPVTIESPLAPELEAWLFLFPGGV
ncbi:MAG: RluA family pseudouridine synthase [Acidobacteria bacterium]|nr:MAG: RluA family pseudouridine synthase [Acidobacteriota bacterium]